MLFAPSSSSFTYFRQWGHANIFSSAAAAKILALKWVLKKKKCFFNQFWISEPNETWIMQDKLFHALFWVVLLGF